MKTIKTFSTVLMLLIATEMAAQKTDADLIDSIQRNLAEDVCRTIVVDNQPERASKTYLRVRGVDESPIVISLDPDSRPAKGKRETSARKNGKAKQVKTAVSKQPETKAAEEEMPAVTETAQQDTATTVAPAILAQGTAEDDNQKYYYGVGGLLLGALLTSPLYFRNRKKNG